MRREYRKAARRQFSAAVEEQLGGFEPAHVDAPILGGDETVFRWVPSDGLHAFLLLVPSPTGHQAFTIELAWSTRGRFPDASMRPTIALGPNAASPIDVDEAVVRLGDLASGEDVWWQLPDPGLDHPGDLDALARSLEPLTAEVADADVAPRMDEAVRTLLQHGVPFLEALAERHTGERRSPS